MLEFYKTIDNVTKRLDAPEHGCWISAVAPTDEEISYLIDDIGVLPEFVKSSLDEEESSHIDYDDDENQTLVIVDYPSAEDSDDDAYDGRVLQYTTLPLGVVIMKGYIITISLYENLNIEDMAHGVVRGVRTDMKTRFLLLLMLRISQRFLIYLRQIDRLSSKTEQKLHQSMKNEELTGMYYDYALAAPYMAGIEEKQDANVLILGLGTGTYATLCDRYFPGIQVEGVEIDQKIADLSRKYFDLPESVSVHVDDGRAFLERAGQYDVIMVDAYQDITIPFQMSSVEFFTMVKEHLKEDGVMVVNMNMRSSKEGSINDCLTDTIASVFSEVYTVTDEGNTNTELFASENPNMVENLSNALGRIQDPALRDMMQTAKCCALPGEMPKKQELLI